MLQRCSFGIVVLLWCVAWGGTSGQQSAAFADLDLRDARAAVLFFVASDCPISNRLIPEMLRLQKEFTTQRVRFIFVYPNVTETAASIRAHQAAFGIEGPVLTDPGRRLGHLTGAQITPEAALLVRRPDGTHVVYLGRIDDRFLSLGTERTKASRHDLEEAITAVLADRPPVAPGGPPVGCAIIAKQ